jgi:hypothetical protein
MQNTEYRIYWTDQHGEAHGATVPCNIVAALALAKRLREQGHWFVTVVGECASQVGSMGVDAVQDGKLPNGDDYVYMKRRSQ